MSVLRVGLGLTFARAAKWRLLAGSLTYLTLGALFIANSVQKRCCAMVARRLGAALLIWCVSPDLGSWRTPRQRRESAPPGRPMTGRGASP